MSWEVCLAVQHWFRVRWLASCFGFIAPSSLSNKLFSWQLTAWVLEVGNHLVAFVLMGAILGAWH